MTDPDQVADVEETPGDDALDADAEADNAEANESDAEAE